MCSPNVLLINHVHALAVTVPQPVRHRLVHYLKSTLAHRKQHGELSLEDLATSHYLTHSSHAQVIHAWQNPNLLIEKKKKNGQKYERERRDSEPDIRKLGEQGSNLFVFCFAEQQQLSPCVIVLDAVDELPRDSLQAVLQLIADKFGELPSFVRLFIAVSTICEEQKNKTNIEPQKNKTKTKQQKTNKETKWKKRPEAGNLYLLCIIVCLFVESRRARDQHAIDAVRASEARGG